MMASMGTGRPRSLLVPPPHATIVKPTFFRQVVAQNQRPLNAVQPVCAGGTTGHLPAYQLVFADHFLNFSRSYVTNATLSGFSLPARARKRKSETSYFCELLLRPFFS
jgi:hypothetical protein